MYIDGVHQGRGVSEHSRQVHKVLQRKEIRLRVTRDLQTLTLEPTPLSRYGRSTVISLTTGRVRTRSQGQTLVFRLDLSEFVEFIRSQTLNSVY